MIKQCIDKIKNYAKNTSQPEKLLAMLDVDNFASFSPEDQQRILISIERTIKDYDENVSRNFKQALIEATQAMKLFKESVARLRNVIQLTEQTGKELQERTELLAEKFIKEDDAVLPSKETMH